MVRNFDMALRYKDEDRIEVLSSKLRTWGHSYFLKVPFMVVHQLFEHINIQLKENPQ